MASSRPLSRGLSRDLSRPLSGGLVVDSSLLGLYPGASVAYSLQDIGGGGNVIRARRSSDNAESDFTAADIDAGNLTSWAGSGDAFVRTWYDQSGNNRNANQTSASSQPQIVDSGSLILNGNGNASLKFDEVDDFLAISKTETLTQQSTFIVAELSSTVANTSCRLYTQGDFTSAELAIPNMHLPSLRASGFERMASYDGGFVGGGAITYDLPFLHSILHSGSLLSPYIDGVATPTASVTLNHTIEQANIGTRSNSTGGGGSYWNGMVTELVDYSSNKSSDRTGIESNIAGRYGITLP